jgi:hypothetical protein
MIDARIGHRYKRGSGSQAGNGLVFMFCFRHLVIASSSERKAAAKRQIVPATRGTARLLEPSANDPLMLGCRDACEPTFESRQSVSSIDISSQLPYLVRSLRQVVVEYSVVRLTLHEETSSQKTSGR